MIRVRVRGTSSLAFPLLLFTLPDGRLIETRSEVATAAPREVGDRVEIVYLPDEPARARVAT